MMALFSIWRPYFAVRTTVLLCSVEETLPRLGVHLQLSRLSSTRVTDHKADDSQRTLEQSPKKLIWEDYKRNYKGAVPPTRTRLRCKRNALKQAGNPCPICRNEIDVSYKNVDLLKQFLSPHTGQILETNKTGVCRLQQKKLVAAIEKAIDHGLLPYIMPQQKRKEETSTPPWNKIHLMED